MIERPTKAFQDEARGTSRSPRVRGVLAALVGVALLGSSALPALGEEYDSSDAGNPLRIVAYVVHPVGVALDYLFLRPMYWVGSHEPFRSLFGRGPQ
jgi:hypothetical protein